MEILTQNTEAIQLTDLFCKNQRSFYQYIANYAASHDDNDDEKDTKPLRIHKINNIIDCIFSPKMHWSFYNAILDTDMCQTIKKHHSNDDDGIIRQILSLASHYQCPMRAQIKPTAIDTENLLKRHGFFELPQGTDAFQFIDFYHNDQVLKSADVHSTIRIYELDDSTQDDCRMRKTEWGDVLCQSFGFPKPQVYGPFYSNVWSRVEVGPTKPIRMFIALKNNQVVGGCHLNLACGVACLYNVTTLQNERGQGIGKALSLIAMISAKEAGYRYLVLQASGMGSPVYKKLGFQSIPPYKVFVKIATAAWYFKIVEWVLVSLTVQRIQRFFGVLRMLSYNVPILTIVMIVMIGLFLAIIFR